MKKNDGLKQSLKNVALVVAVLGVGALLGALAHLTPLGPSTPKVEFNTGIPAEKQEAAVPSVDQAAKAEPVASALAVAG